MIGQLSIWLIENVNPTFEKKNVNLGEELLRRICPQFKSEHSKRKCELPIATIDSETGVTTEKLCQKQKSLLYIRLNPDKPKMR
jgi:hypothetical protein